VFAALFAKIVCRLSFNKPALEIKHYWQKVYAEVELDLKLEVEVKLVKNWNLKLK